MADGDARIVDRARIDLEHSWELGWWSRKWEVSEDRLIAAVKAAGPLAADVAKRLGKPNPDIH